MSRSIQHQVFFAHPPQAVWEYLTDSELMSLWLMKNNFQLIDGSKFQFRTKPLPQFDFDGIAYCKVLQIIPLKKLSYSWKGGPGDGTFNLDSVVVWTLVEKNNGTELTLHHSGFSEVGNVLIYDAMNTGWLKNMHKIDERLNTADHGTA